jgi:hypothetical protein
MLLRLSAVLIVATALLTAGLISLPALVPLLWAWISLAGLPAEIAALSPRLVAIAVLLISLPLVPLLAALTALVALTALTLLPSVICHGFSPLASSPSADYAFSNDLANELGGDSPVKELRATNHSLR